MGCGDCISYLFLNNALQHRVHTHNKYPLNANWISFIGKIHCRQFSPRVRRLADWAPHLVCVVLAKHASPTAPSQGSLDPTSNQHQILLVAAILDFSEGPAQLHHPPGDPLNIPRAPTQVHFSLCPIFIILSFPRVLIPWGLSDQHPTRVTWHQEQVIQARRQAGACVASSTFKHPPLPHMDHTISLGFPFSLWAQCCSVRWALCLFMAQVGSYVDRRRQSWPKASCPQVPPMDLSPGLLPVTVISSCREWRGGEDTPTQQNDSHTGKGPWRRRRAQRAFGKRLAGGKPRTWTDASSAVQSLGRTFNHSSTTSHEPPRGSTTGSIFNILSSGLPLFPLLFAMKWWDQMPWS